MTLATTSGRSARGFTLLEILLALAIVALLSGLAIVNFGLFRGRQALDDGAQQFETGIRLARAEAANTGRRLRISFNPQDGRAVLLWEPDPLTQPGRYVEYAACTWKDVLAPDGVQVQRCQYVGTSAYRLLGGAELPGLAPADTGLADITFEPDGSSDSVLVELVGTDAPETRRALIELDGLTGTITSRIVTESELGE